MLKKTAFIHADKNCSESDDFEEWDEQISGKNALLEQIFAGTKCYCSSVKEKFLSNSAGFVLWRIKKQAANYAKFYESFEHSTLIFVNPFQVIFVFLCTPETISAFQII